MPDEDPSFAAPLLREQAAEAAIVGSVLDARYRVDRVIGAGGFGTVYAGFHLTLGQPVAIKVFRMPEDSSAAKRAELISGFVEEARLLTRLRHENIVRMLDQGFLAGDMPSPYAVMELCPHGSLRAYLAEQAQPLALDRALELVKGIVAGMRHAHEAGIAHRDLKPGNVMLERRADGSLVPRIIDFGIAKLTEEGDTAGSGATRTRSAAVSFTPAYAAPEQAIGGRTGTWTDVHAIGLIFCELLTGAPPYGHDDLSLKIIDPVRPTPAAAGVEAGPFEAVIQRALSIRPDERYPDATRLEEAILEAERVSREPPPLPPVAVARGGRRALLLGAGALAAVGAIAGAGFVLRRKDEPAPEAAASLAEISAIAPPSASAPSASASATAPRGPITLATLTAADVVERMLGAGLAPVTPPAADASMHQLMVPFKRGTAIGAVYANELTLPPEIPVAAHALIALMNVRGWIAADRQQGYELAYLIAKHRVFSMTWAPKPGEQALQCFQALAKDLPFDARGCSWMGEDPSADARLTKPLWFAKRLGELTTEELLFRLEASGAAPKVDQHSGHFLAALARRGVRGELSFFKNDGTTENAKALELAEILRKQRKPFVSVRDGSAALIAYGPLSNVAFVSELLAGIEATPELVKI